MKIKIEITNLDEFKKHVQRCKSLIKEAEEEINIINNFKFEISTEKE